MDFSYQNSYKSWCDDGGNFEELFLFERFSDKSFFKRFGFSPTAKLNQLMKFWSSDTSSKQFINSYLCFRLALLHSKFYFFFLYLTDEVLSINPSANVLSLETLTSIIRTGLPILVELIELVNSVIIFLSQLTLLKGLTFLDGSQTVILIVLLFSTYFSLLLIVFVLQWLFLHWEILIMLSQFALTFHQIHKGIPCFIT